MMDEEEARIRNDYGKFERKLAKERDRKITQAWNEYYDKRKPEDMKCVKAIEEHKQAMKEGK